MTNDEVVHAYVEALRIDDHETVTRLRHADWTCDYPQSGERIRGDANERAMLERYPGGAPRVAPMRLIGSEDRFVVTPSMTLERVVGDGDHWWADGRARYPDGSEWFVVVLVELRGGKIYREIEFFGQTFEAPAWRAPFVEHIDDR